MEAGADSSRAKPGVALPSLLQVGNAVPPPLAKAIGLEIKRVPAGQSVRAPQVWWGLDSQGCDIRLWDWGSSSSGLSLAFSGLLRPSSAGGWVCGQHSEPGSVLWQSLARAGPISVDANPGHLEAFRGHLSRAQLL